MGLGPHLIPVSGALALVINALALTGQEDNFTLKFTCGCAFISFDEC